jgi:steroid delta-isomerase-like uncharacterized protein
MISRTGGSSHSNASNLHRKQGVQVMSEGNKAIGYREVEEFWNRGKLEVADELHAETYVFRAAGIPEVKGVEGIKALARTFRTAFPDLHFQIDDAVAEGNKVAWRWTMRGTNLGEWAGTPPTGKKVTLTGMGIDRYEGGKIVESWANMDDLGLIQQLGVVSLPPSK